MTWKKFFAERIREARSLAGITSRQKMATLCGVSMPAVEKWETGKAEPADSPAGSSRHSLHGRVSVAGTARQAGITCVNESGGTDQMEVRLPWSKQFQGRPGQRLYVSAQNKTDQGGLTVQIVLNGAVVQSGPPIPPMVSGPPAGGFSACSPELALGRSFAIPLPGLLGQSAEQGDPPVRAHPCG